MSKLGTATVVGVLGAGIWLMVAPFALRIQPPHAGWTGPTRSDVITGAVLAVTGFGGLFAVIAGRVREIYADAASVASLAGSSDSAGTREMPGP